MNRHAEANESRSATDERLLRASLLAAELDLLVHNLYLKVTESERRQEDGGAEAASG